MKNNPEIKRCPTCGGSCFEETITSWTGHKRRVLRASDTRLRGARCWACGGPVDGVDSDAMFRAIRFGL